MYQKICIGILLLIVGASEGMARVSSEESDISPYLLYENVSIRFTLTTDRTEVCVTDSFTMHISIMNIASYPVYVFPDCFFRHYLNSARQGVGISIDYGGGFVAGVDVPVTLHVIAPSETYEFKKSLTGAELVDLKYRVNKPFSIEVHLGYIPGHMYVESIGDNKVRVLSSDVVRELRLHLIGVLRMELKSCDDM